MGDWVVEILIDLYCTRGFIVYLPERYLVLRRLFLVRLAKHYTNTYSFNSSPLERLP